MKALYDSGRGGVTPECNSPKEQKTPLFDVLVIGGGPAGLAAAISATENDAEHVCVLERQHELGGILNQCIHNGFGLHHFKKELTGPEYAARFIEQLTNHPNIEVLSGAMVLSVEQEEKTGIKLVYAIQGENGYLQLRTKAAVFAMGCRERPRGAIGIAGTRPAGVFTAGAAQLYMNIEGYHVGKRVVILGSGDIGLIMARRLTLEGAKVLGVYEVLPYSGGLTRNIVQCLEDYGIPLHLSRTITEIRGERRVSQVVVQKVDENRKPIAGTEEVIAVDTVLLSVGLIPENELSRNAGLEMSARTNGPVVYENMETSVPGIFACGNVAHVHDLVDFVTAEGMRAGKAAAKYSRLATSTTNNANNAIIVSNGTGVGYTVPQKIRPDNISNAVDIFFRVTGIYKLTSGSPLAIEVASGDDVIASFKREHLAPGEMEKITLPKALLLKASTQAGITVRVNGTPETLTGETPRYRVEHPNGVTELICITCPKGCHLQVDAAHDYKVSGHSCERGEQYGRQEVSNPMRTVTSTVRVKTSAGSVSERLPVKTDGNIPKAKIADAMRLLDELEIMPPIKSGDVVANGDGITFVATASLN